MKKKTHVKHYSWQAIFEYGINLFPILHQKIMQLLCNSQIISNIKHKHLKLNIYLPVIVTLHKKTYN